MKKVVQLRKLYFQGIKLGSSHASGDMPVTSGHARVFERIKPAEITLEACRKQYRVQPSTGLPAQLVENASWTLLRYLGGSCNKHDMDEQQSLFRIDLCFVLKF